MSGHLAPGHLGVDDDRFLFPLFVDLEVGRDDSCLAGDSFPVKGRLDILTGQIDQQAVVVTDIVDQGLGLPLFPEIGDNTFGQVRHLCVELHPVGLDQVERPKGAVAAGSDLKMLLGKQELLCREIGGLQVLEYDARIGQDCLQAGVLCRVELLETPIGVGRHFRAYLEYRGQILGGKLCHEKRERLSLVLKARCRALWGDNIGRAGHGFRRREDDLHK